MPLDELMGAMGASIAHAGPEWALALAAIGGAIWAAKNVWLPWTAQRSELARQAQEARIALEAKREERKARESESRDKHDEEQNRLTGQWLSAYERGTQVQEQTNVLLAGFDARMGALEAALDESKDRSRGMASEVHDLHSRLIPAEGRGDGHREMGAGRAREGR